MLVRNARNREERALRGLDHAQRRYNEDPDAARYANTINGNHDNMTQVAYVPPSPFGPSPPLQNTASLA